MILIICIGLLGLALLHCNSLFCAALFLPRAHCFNQDSSLTKVRAAESGKFKFVNKSINMYRNFRTDAEKDEIARQYLEKRRQRKKKKRTPKWFPGPACKLSKVNPEKVKVGPEYSAIATLKKTEEWKNEDTILIEACTVEWVKKSFDEQTELRVAKVPYLHGVLWQNHAVSRDGTNPIILCDHTGEIEVRLHDQLRARFRKQLLEKHSEPAILMKKVSIFKTDDGKEFYACCSLQNFIHLVGPDRQENDYPSSFCLQYGAQDVSELDLPQTCDLTSNTQLTKKEPEGETVSQAVLLPRPGYIDGRTFSPTSGTFKLSK